MEYWPPARRAYGSESLRIGENIGPLLHRIENIMIHKINQSWIEKISTAVLKSSGFGLRRVAPTPRKARRNCPLCYWPVRYLPPRAGMPHLPVWKLWACWTDSWFLMHHGGLKKRQYPLLTHWVRPNICTYQRASHFLTASYGVFNPEPWTLNRSTYVVD